MGSSAKKKKDKKKDFQAITSTKTVLHDRWLIVFLQKPKLKVGKARPKASNFTDTSFKSKCKDAPKSPRWYQLIE